MNSTLFAILLLIVNLISYECREEKIEIDEDIILTTYTSQKEHLKDKLSDDSFQHSLFDLNASENNLGRYYRYWNEDPLNHTIWPFPEYYKWIDHNCIRRNIRFDDEFEIAGFCLIFILVIFANIAGISGGYLTIVILYEVFGFESRKTFGYAAFINLCAVLMRYFYYFKFRNPVKNYQTLIDYEMALILFPLSIFGTIWGSLLYNVLPMLSIAILDGAWWGIISLVILVKTFKLFRSEKLIEKANQIKKINESKNDLSIIYNDKQQIRKMLYEHEKNDK